MADEKELTYGQKLMGVRFNPSGSSKVDRIKQLAAEIVDLMEEHKEEQIKSASLIGQRFTQQAVSSMVVTQMLCEKAITWELANG